MAVVTGKTTQQYFMYSLLLPVYLEYTTNQPSNIYIYFSDGF